MLLERFINANVNIENIAEITSNFKLLILVFPSSNAMFAENKTNNTKRYPPIKSIFLTFHILYTIKY